MDERLNKVVDELQKLAKGDDLHNIRSLVKHFDDALTVSDRIAMGRYSKGAFTLEKKYIPQIPDNDYISQKLRCESMIMTVGFQKEPIILSILCMKPKKVILLHTEGSRGKALEVETDPDVKDMHIEITPLLITEYDASANYRIIRDAALPRSTGVTVIDPTAGRKVMVASLALTAFYLRFPMVYLYSVELYGIIFPFTERLKFIENPFDFFGDTELGLVAEQFNCHLYEAAFKTCEQLEQKVRDPATHSKVIELQELIGVYRDWDAFLHSSVPEDKRPTPLLSERLEKVINDFSRLGFVRCLPENVEPNLCFLKSLDETWRNKKNIADEFRLVDIFVSALRRGTEKQKKYDDAVGRLYRCLEICSTIKLIKLGLQDTAKPNYDAFSAKIGINTEKLENEYEKQKHRKLPSERLGLEDQMTLLAIAGENVARIYESMKRQDDRSDSLMDIRNRSILAHGTNPVTEDCWPKFRDKVEVIIKDTIGKEKFQELRSMAMHGKLNIA